MHKWIGLILIIIGMQAVAADDNEPRVVHVKESKSLWSVALAAKPTGVRMWQAVIALYERNPHAFYDNDVNKLKDNVALVVPSTELMLSLTEAEALARFQLLGDQPDLDKVTLDIPSMPLVDLTRNIPLAAPIIPVLNNTQESTEHKTQNLTTLNQEDETPVETSCLLLACNPISTILVDTHGFSNVGDFYVSIGAAILNDYSIDSSSDVSEDASYQLKGRNGLDINVGYLWRDGVVLELGYQKSNSEFYSVDVGAATGFYGQNGVFNPTRQTELISPKIILIEDIGKNTSIYSGLGVGWYKDTYNASSNIQNTTYHETVSSGLYQIILGSKVHLTNDLFIDLRVQNKHYLPKVLPYYGGRSSGKVTVHRHNTFETTLSIGMDL